MGKPALSAVACSMPPLPNVLAFALASAILIAVPGPSVLFVIGRSLVYGRAGGLLSVLGNTAGVIVQVVAVSLGIGAIVTESAVVFTVIKLAGAGYLVYLGVQAIRHRNQRTPTRIETPRRSKRRLLGESFIVGLTNPKAVVFFIAVLPQFVDNSGASVPLQLAALGTVFAVIALAFDSTWAVAAGTARDWFARSPKRIARMRGAGGVMMIGLGGVLALTGSKS
jgi:threonine/homoserine/homoserine lactone efflux protein